MSNLLFFDETLVYFDGPEIFVGRDAVDTKYLCVAIPSSEFSFLCVPLSHGRLNAFRLREIDLRSVFVESETQQFFICDTANNDLSSLVMQRMDNPPPENLLPDAGFFMPPNSVYVEDSGLCEESYARNRLLIDLHLNPPEAQLEPRISAERLAGAALTYQRLLRRCHAKSTAGTRCLDRTGVRSPDNATVHVYGFSPGSFTLRLESASKADSLGFCELSRALRMIDQLAERFSDPDSEIEFLRPHKGHVVAAFKDFVEFMVENNTPVKYSWSMPECKVPISRILSFREADIMLDALRTNSKLGEEAIELVGVFKKIDVDRGTWRILSDDGRSHSGSVAPESTVTLNGSVAGSGRYKLTCIERLVEATASGRQKSEILLNSYEKI